MEIMEANKIESISTRIKLHDAAETAAFGIIQRCKFKTKEEADEQVIFYERMLDTLSKSLKVYVRRSPKAERNASFDTDEIVYEVSVRFTLGWGDGMPELLIAADHGS